MADNTVFDSVFKTMVHKQPRLLIPFINETFGRNYPADSPITPFSNEHENMRGTIVDDSVFRLQNKIYHIECQSTSDANMVVRMVEYDFAIALEQALSNGAPYEMDFPASCVLFLRHTRNTPDVLSMKVNLPDGESFEYRTKVVKAQLFSSDDIFDKRLLILFPYYLMRYEHELSHIEESDERANSLVAECVDLRLRLAEAVAADADRILYEQLIELIIKVSDYLTEGHELLQGRVKAAMGGEVLELWHDRAVRLEAEAMQRGQEIGEQIGRENGLMIGLEQGREQGLEQGLEQGREQGLEQGLEQGRELGIDLLAARLRELGVDESLLEQATASIAAREQE